MSYSVSRVVQLMSSQLSSAIIGKKGCKWKHLRNFSEKMKTTLEDGCH